MMDSQKIAAAAPDRSPWAMVVSDLMAAVNALVAGTRTRTRAVLVGMFVGLPLLISGCAQHKEGSTVLPCELLTKAKVPVALQLGRIVVSVKLNGQPVRMLVDTGANTSTIAPHIAESIGGTYNREKLVHINGVGGRSDAQRPYKVKTIQMGPLHWFDFEVMVVNISREPKRNDPEAVVGIIGNDLLRWYDLELDFQRGEMTVYQVLNCKGDFIPWEKPYQILRSPVNRERFFIVPVELNGRPSAQLSTPVPEPHLSPERPRLALERTRRCFNKGKRKPWVGWWGLRHQHIRIASIPWKLPVNDSEIHLSL